MADVFINRIATAVPRHEVHGAFRAFAAAKATAAGVQPAFARMDARAGIATRHSVLEPSLPLGSGTECGFYRAGSAFPTTRTRMARYEAEAPALGACTGFVAPCLDRHLAERHGLPRGVRAFGMGD